LQDSFTIKNIIQKFDIVFSIHCQKIFPTILVEEVKCINLHPGYNPENKGWYPQVFSILNGKKFGATLHEMDSEIDGGPIIAQEQINIEFKDTSYTAYQKVLKLEK
jgi:methionyl-tRNA formyltransferase